jgi:hypothetical protein
VFYIVTCTDKILRENKRLSTNLFVTLTSWIGLYSDYSTKDNYQNKLIIFICLKQRK